MRYHAPLSFNEAVDIAAGSSGAVRFLAGGTDVLVQLRSGMHQPDDLIDLKRIPGARDIEREPDGGWAIGAAVPSARLGEEEDLVRAWPGVIEAMELVGSTQVQSRATLVGNLCNASPAADSVPAMIAAGATVSVLGPEGTRRLPVADVVAAPGRTTLAKGEVVTTLHLPAPQPGQGDAYLRFTPRTEMDIAVVGCGIWLRREGGVVTEARVALGAVAPTAIEVPEAAAAITGTPLDEAALEALAEAASQAGSPIDDKRGTAKFRRHVAGVLARRVAQIAHDRAGGK